MGKFVALLIVGLGLLTFIYAKTPTKSVEPQTIVVEETAIVEPTEAVSGVDESVIRSFENVCDSAATTEFGKDFAELDTAVTLCTNTLVSVYAELGHWPSPNMYGNVSEAFYAGNRAAKTWESLNTSFIYYTSDGRETIMKFLKEQRLAMG